MDNGFQGKEGQVVPEMTEEFCTSVSERYIELYEHIVGEKFVKADIGDVESRIERNVNDFLRKWFILNIFVKIPRSGVFTFLFLEISVLAN